jgi:hypothetical protein
MEQVFYTMDLNMSAFQNVLEETELQIIQLTVRKKQTETSLQTLVRQKNELEAKVRDIQTTKKTHAKLLVVGNSYLISSKK